MLCVKLPIPVEKEQFSTTLSLFSKAQICLCYTSIQDIFKGYFKAVCYTIFVFPPLNWPWQPSHCKVKNAWLHQNSMTETQTPMLHWLLQPVYVFWKNVFLVALFILAVEPKFRKKYILKYKTMSKGAFNFSSRGAICSLKHFIWHNAGEKVHEIPGPRASVSFLSWETWLPSAHLGPTCVWCSSIFATLVLFVLWYLIQ